MIYVLIYTKPDQKFMTSPGQKHNTVTMRRIIFGR
jgi:hypothetical protein